MSPGPQGPQGFPRQQGPTEERVSNTASTTTQTTLTPADVTVGPTEATSTTLIFTSPPGSSSPPNPTTSATVASSAGANGSGQSNGGEGLATAAVAGIAIGCLVVGLLAGLLVACCLLRRRRQRSNESEPLYLPAYASPMPDESKYLSDVPQSPLPPSLMMSTKTAVASVDGGGGGSDPLRMDQFLLTAAPDKKIAGELKALGDLIKKHVESNYHRQPVSATQASLTQMLLEIGLGKDAAIAPGQIASLALKPKTRFAALQHIIARAVIGSVTLSTTSRFSLLPPSMAAFMKEMAPTERHRGNPEAVSAAFTRWRQLSAFLIHPCRNDRTALIPTHAAVGERARELVTALNGFLGVFVDQDSGGEGVEQEKHLYDLVMECAKFGYMLVSQPGEFRLRYDGGPVPGDDIVVCPGLDKISDEQGSRYSPCRTLLPPTIEATR